VATDCAAAGLPVVFAEAASGVLEQMKTAGTIVPGLTFPTVDEACAHVITMRKPAAQPRPLRH